jgi:hypothetical protein
MMAESRLPNLKNPAYLEHTKGTASQQAQNLQAQAISQRFAKSGKLFSLVLLTVALRSNGSKGHSCALKFDT